MIFPSILYIVIIVHVHYSHYFHYDSVSAGCKNGDVRLVNGKSELEGTVEMCIDGAWGTVVGSLLSFQTARLICEQLGYPSECE